MLKFDTRDKKPKVWNIAVISAVLAVVLAVLLTRQEISLAAVGWAFGIWLVLTIVFLMRALIRQIQYNPYSYNTIYYIGFSLFLAVVLIFHIVLMVRAAGGEYAGREGVVTLYYMLLNSAKQFMFYTAPFILLFSAALCISNVSLIRHEGRRLVNILGILLAVILVGGEILVFRLDFYTTGSMTEVMIHDIVTNVLAALYLYFECMLIGSIAANVIVVRYEPEPDKDFVIILGCGIRKDGTPSPLLAGRIDRALRFGRKQLEQTGKEPVYIASGGKGPDEVISEGEAIRNYLLGKGVPAEQILVEDRSRSTRENMLYSQKIIQSVNPKGRPAFSTTNYHVFRSGLMARRVKMRAVGMGARTKWYFWPNAAVREFVGILTEHRLKQGLILGGLIALYTISTVILYRFIV